MFMNDSGQLFGKVNVVDFMSGAAVVLITLGVIAVQSGWYRTSGQVVKGESDIEYTVYMRNVQTLQPNLIQEGKTLSITIRNQPRGKVDIVKVERNQPQAVVPASGGYRVIDDPTLPNGHNYRVTLRDHATITDDGYVTEGVKVKIGMNIDVEGKDYRIPGLIIGVKEVADNGTGKVR